MAVKLYVKQTLIRKIMEHKSNIANEQVHDSNEIVFTEIRNDENRNTLNHSRKSIHQMKDKKSTSLVKDKKKSKQTTDENHEKVNPEYVYEQEVYKVLKAEEIDRPPKPIIFEQKTTIKPYMREVVIDWLVSVHRDMKMHTDTLFTAIAIADFYLSKQDVNKAKLQLLYITALYMAMKMEEVELNEVGSFTYYVRNQISKEEIFDMEYKIFSEIGFNCVIIHSSIFLKKYLALVKNPTIEITMFAHYINETMLLESRLTSVSPSKRATAVVCIALEIIRGKGSCLEFLRMNKEYKKKEIQPLIDIIVESMRTIKSQEKYKSSKRKFNKDYFKYVSRIEIPESIKITSIL